jgi:hypothetical protein
MTGDRKEVSAEEEEKALKLTNILSAVRVQGMGEQGVRVDRLKYSLSILWVTYKKDGGAEERAKGELLNVPQVAVF